MEQMMKRRIEPDGISPPASAYAHAIFVQDLRDLLMVSGQLGEYPDGSCAEGVSAQAEQAWANISAILSAAGMKRSDIIKVTSYIVGAENIDPYVDVHRRELAGLEPPWTLVVVPALGRKQYLVEVDVTAARSADDA
jgi:2-iminobutanoate/2-iminopropanoate deaminase